MELQPTELKQIIKAYRLKNMSFVGYEKVLPDDVIYYFNDIDDNLFILVASDYVTWACGNGEPPKNIQYDYYPKHERNFSVEKWLTLHDGLDKNSESGDYDGYIYWASNGDRCTMAKIKGKISDFKLDNLNNKIPYHAKTDIAIYAKKMIMSETVSAIPRPSYQNEKQLDKNIRDAIIDDLKYIANYFLNMDVKDIKLSDIKNLNKDAFLYATQWDDFVFNEYKIEQKIIAINNQSWLALCEFREKPDTKDELNKLLQLLRDFA